MRVHDGRVATMGILCDVPVHELTAGDKQLLQPSRNGPMHQAGAYAHLRCGLRLESGRRYLLLGRNGVGKSTLLQAIADGSLPDWPERVTTYLVAPSSATLCADCDNRVNVVESVAFAGLFGKCGSSGHPRCLECVSRDINASSEDEF